MTWDINRLFVGKHLLSRMKWSIEIRHTLIQPSTAIELRESAGAISREDSLRRHSLLALCLIIATWGPPRAAAQDNLSPADDFTTLVTDESDSEPVGTRIPLILVHGLHGNAIGTVDDITNLKTDYFQQLIAYLGENSVIGQRFKIFRFHYVSDRFSIADIGKAMRNDLDGSIQDGTLPDTGFVVVAHSLGGLVTRAYMEERHTVGVYAGQPGGERISRLVTLATPHHGTHGANDAPRLSAFEDPAFENILAGLDRVAWCGSAICPGDQFVEVTEPNRADARWDAYDSATAYNQCPNECNLWLQTLNQSQSYDNKIVAYFGFVNAENTPLFAGLQGLTFSNIPYELLAVGPSGLLSFLTFAAILGKDHDLAVGAAVLLDKIYPSFPGDGVVPTDSAGFAGHDIRRLVGCPGYDHLHMRDSKSGSLCENGVELFRNIRTDLLDVSRIPGTEPFTLTDRGGISTTSQGTADTPTLGYGRIRPDTGMTTPSGLAIFGFTQNGVLVSEAGVPAAAPIQEGRIFAEVSGPVNTGLAIANPNDVAATISFFFTDATGTNFGSDSFTLGANQQTAKFLNQAPFNGGSSVLGTFTFASSVPISVVALRGFTNERSDFLITTLPVAPLSSTSTDTIYFPHFADGGGWTTQIILVNPTDTAITGNIEFLGQGSGTTAATLVTLTLVGRATESSYSYSISPRSSQRFTTSNPAGAASVGSVRVTPDVGSTSPSGLGVFSFATGGFTVSEAGVPALPKASSFRVYVEASGTPGAINSVRSGLAITDTSGTANTVTLELTDLDGATIGAAEILSIPPSGQVARFLDEFFTLPSNFSGVLRVTSTSDVAIVGLRARVNQRSDFLITTTPPTNEVAAPTSVDTYFPHLADSGGWSTQFVLFSGTAGQSSSGNLSFIDQEGQTLDLSVSSAATAFEVRFH